MSSRAARVARGLVVAGFATFVAALFHVAGGGAPPSALALTLSLMFSGLGCIALAGKRSRLWRSAVSVSLSQFLFHGLFMLSPSGHFAGRSGHVHAGTHLVLVPVSPEPMSAGTDHSGAAMWLSHLVAGLVTLVALRYGERTLRAVCGIAALPLRRLMRLVALGSPSTPVRRVRVETVPSLLPSRVVLLGGFRHRGPPSVMRPA